MGDLPIPTDLYWITGAITIVFFGSKSIKKRKGPFHMEIGPLEVVGFV